MGINKKEIHTRSIFCTHFKKMKSLWPISIVTIVSSLIHRSASIDCYSCDSSSDFTCSEFWDPSEDVNTKYYNDCSEVQDSKYCVKMTGVYDGKLGTKRFCSSRDWGDYCEYIQRPGDPREYRSCIYSCSTNYCNGTVHLSINQSLFAILLLISYCLNK